MSSSRRNATREETVITINLLWLFEAYPYLKVYSLNCRQSVGGERETFNVSSRRGKKGSVLIRDK
jgi:hypothetical protein